MTLNGWLQIAVFFVLVLLAAKPMGLYLAQVYDRKRTWLDPVLSPVERLLYKLTGVDADEEMRWTQYASAMLIFSLATMLLTYAVERLQHLLPLNPQHLAAVEPYLAWNTAVSFTTNTNWQAYVPESTMSYLTQMVGLATHNFWSAAVGMALAVAFIRGIARRESKTLGNFWVDLTRGTLWVLLPMCLVYALALVSQGVVQNLKPYDTATLIEPQTVTVTGTDGKVTTTRITTQTIAQGPVASQEAIKMLGTNGGGFFNANSSHPFENPTLSPTWSRCFRSSSSPPDSPSRLAAWSALPATAGLSSPRCPSSGSPASSPATTPRPSRTRCSTASTSAPRSAPPAATWRARRSASASPTPPSSPPSPPTQAAARSTPCTTPSCPSAAWFPWSTSCSARSSSAASAQACTAC